MATYRPGQEVDKRPSDDYLAVIRDVIAYWMRFEPVEEETNAIPAD